jgi:hypothetical protein
MDAGNIRHQSLNHRRSATWNDRLSSGWFPKVRPTWPVTLVEGMGRDEHALTGSYASRGIHLYTHTHPALPLYPSADQLVR